MEGFGFWIPSGLFPENLNNNNLNLFEVLKIQIWVHETLFKKQQSSETNKVDNWKRRIKSSLSVKFNPCRMWRISYFDPILAMHKRDKCMFIPFYGLFTTSMHTNSPLAWYANCFLYFLYSFAKIAYIISLVETLYYCFL